MGGDRVFRTRSVSKRLRNGAAGPDRYKTARQVLSRPAAGGKIWPLHLVVPFAPSAPTALLSLLLGYYLYPISQNPLSKSEYARWIFSLPKNPVCLLARGHNTMCERWCTKWTKLITALLVALAALLTIILAILKFI